MEATQKLKFWCQMVLQIALGLLLLQTASASAMDQKRDIVNVGSIIALDTIIGKVAKTAIELAVEDINARPDVLNTTLLNIDIRDSTQDAVQGASAAIELIRKECVAIVGPQTSVVADFVAYLADAAQVPIVTFAATNPSLSMDRFPYFIRITESDSRQMKAIAELIPHYGWREVVVVYVDDDFGTGAIPALNDELKAVEAKVVYRAAIPVQANASDMRKVLKDKLFKRKSRVFIVHMHPDSGAVFFSQAKDLGMMSSEYVWIITEGIASQLESLNSTSLMSMQGVLGIKTHIPDSNPRLEDFTPRWKERFKAEHPTMQNPNWTVYGLTAYDTVWAIAHAIDRLQVGGGFKNNFTVPLAKQKKGQSLDMKVFQGGDELRREILDTNFSGLSGPVRLSKNGERLNCFYDIVNVVGSKGYNVVGSWTKRKALQIHKEAYVVWPGGLTKVPRGWLIPPPGEKLKIAVPWEKGFTQFLSVKQQNGNQTYNITGFCIDVFKAVLSKLDYKLLYELVPYGSGNVTPGYYDELVYQVYLEKFDAVVGDVAVIANRSKYVDFTQPYTETGLVMMVRIQQGGSSDPWAFLRPFTPAMWITTLAFFFFTGAVVWLLEHRRNRHFRGKPRKQILTFLWFSFSTLFSTQSKKNTSPIFREAAYLCPNSTTHSGSIWIKIDKNQLKLHHLDKSGPETKFFFTISNHS